MADHNDPNSVNSIFSDIDISAADLYDLFGSYAPAFATGVVLNLLNFAIVGLLVARQTRRLPQDLH